MQTHESILILVLCWNNLKDTLDCLASLKELDYPEFCVLVVDNASEDGTIEAVRARHPEVMLLRNEKNLGFAEGNNVGLRYALDHDCDYVLVLNNDTVVDPACLTNLIADIAGQEDVAAVAPLSFFYDSRTMVHFAGGRIGPGCETIHVGIGDFYEDSQWIASDTEWLTGCAILFKCGALREVGLFDPQYFLLFEDVDWCLRARRAGYRLRIVPSAQLWHKVSPSFGGGWSALYHYYYIRNHLRLIQLYCHHKHRLLQYLKSVRYSQQLIWRQVAGTSLSVQLSLWKAMLKGINDFAHQRFGEGWR